MAVALVPYAGDLGQGAQLTRRQQAVRNGHAQHGGVALHVEAVAQAQRAELVFRQGAGQEAACLVAELRHALIHQSLVYFVVLIHPRSIVLMFFARPPAT